MLKTLKYVIFLEILFLSFSASIHGQDIYSWWDNMGEYYGVRISIKAEGWNFWYKNDSDYLYSDPIGSFFSGDFDYINNQVVNYPIIGASLRFPFWKFFLFQGVITLNRISIGTGIGIPIGNFNFNVTPWGTAGVTFANGTFPALSFDCGIEILLNKYIFFGFEFSYSDNAPLSESEGWRFINYGLSFGVKVK